MDLRQTIEEIKYRLPISSLLAKYGINGAPGKNINCIFPGHDDRNPSCSILPDDNAIYCHGCHRYADVIELTQLFENCSFMEALQSLCAQVGLEFTLKDQNIDSDENRKFAQIVDFYTALSQEAHRELLQSSDLLQAFCENYGLTEDIIKKFQIGYVSANVITKFDRIKFRESGLINSHGHIIVADRYLFPYFYGKRVIYLNARVRFGVDTKMKYVKPIGKQLPSFIAKDFLYNINDLKTAHKDEIIIVEGPTDVLALAQQGIKAIAVNTANISDSVLKDILYYRNKAIYFLAFDGDDAGQRGMYKSALKLLEKGIDPQIIQLPEGEDVASYCKNHDFENLLNDAQYLLEIEAYKLKKIKSPKKIAKALKNFHLYIPKTQNLEQEISIATKTISSILGKDKIPSKVVKSILKNEAEENISPEENEEGELLFSYNNEFIFKMPDYCYVKKVLKADGSMLTVQLTDFVLKLKGVAYEAYDIEDGEFIHTDQTSIFVIYQQGKEPKEVELNANAVVRWSSFQADCHANGVFVKMNIDDRTFANIIAAESAQSKHEEIYYFTAVGKYDNFFITPQFVYDYNTDNIIQPDEKGIFTLPNGKHMIVGYKQKGKQKLRIEMVTEEPEPDFYRKAVDAIYSCWGVQGIVALAWTLAAYFKDEFIRMFDVFPLASWHGQAGSGKSTMVDVFRAVTGLKDKLEVGSTKASLRRIFRHYSNIPIFLDEYRKEDNDKDSLFRSVYNNSPMSIADNNSKYSNVIYYPTAAVGLSGEEITSDDALYSRFVIFGMKKIKDFMIPYTTKLQPIKHQLSYLAYFTITKVHPTEGEWRRVRANYEKLIAERAKELELDIDVRELLNWSIVLAAWFLLIRPYIMKPGEACFVKNEDVVDYVIMQLTEKQTVKLETNVVNEFFATVKNRLNDPQIDVKTWIDVDYNEDGTISKVYLAVHSMVHEFMMRKYFVSNFQHRTIAAYIKKMEGPGYPPPKDVGRYYFKRSSKNKGRWRATEFVFPTPNQEFNDLVEILFGDNFEEDSLELS